MPAKILSVDDSKVIRTIVKRTFAPFDATVLEACDGEEGLTTVTAENPDLIVPDITMPMMEGVTMLTKLKENEPLKSIPVIMLAAESGRENVAYIAKLGVRDYLVKPFRDTQQIEKIQRVIALQPKAAAVAA
jgi:two-component system cell cycle response regulator